MGPADREGIWINAASLKFLPRRFRVADARTLVTRLPVENRLKGVVVQVPTIRS